MERKRKKSREEEKRGTKEEGKRRNGRSGERHAVHRSRKTVKCTGGVSGHRVERRKRRARERRKERKGREEEAKRKEAAVGVQFALPAPFCPVTKHVASESWRRWTNTRGEACTSWRGCPGGFTRFQNGGDGRWSGTEDVFQVFQSVTVPVLSSSSFSVILSFYPFSSLSGIGREGKGRNGEIQGRPE